MAYSDEREALLVIERRTDEVHIDRIKDKNGDKIDFRQYFESEEGNILPTKRGVRISAEMTLDIIKALIPLLEEDEKMELLTLLTEE